MDNSQDTLRKPVTKHLNVIQPTNPNETSILFGRWLLYYFIPWNPEDDTWLDCDFESYTTEELFILFKKEILNNESNT